MKQLFKTIPNREVFDKFIKQYCIQERNYYKITPETYKQMQYNQVIQPFLNDIKIYYHMSKQKYINRKMTYPRFVTILRHLCKMNEITYTSIMKYSNSTYQIHYLFYI